MLWTDHILVRRYAVDILWYAMYFLQKDQIIHHIEIKWLGFDYTLVQPKMFAIFHKQIYNHL